MSLQRSPTRELPVNAEPLQGYLEEDGFWDALEELEDAGKVEVIYPANLDEPTKIILKEPIT